MEEPDGRDHRNSDIAGWNDCGRFNHQDYRPFRRARAMNHTLRDHEALLLGELDASAFQVDDEATFENKEKLFETVFIEAAGQLFPRVNAIFNSDEPLFEQIEKFCDDAIATNPNSVADYKSGKVAALNFLKGQVMKLSKGQANPNLAGEILERKLKG